MGRGVRRRPRRAGRARRDTLPGKDGARLQAGSGPRLQAAGRLAARHTPALAMFRRSHEDPVDPPARVAPTDLVAFGLAHFTPLSVPQCAAEILTDATAALDQDALAMDQLLAAWLPASDWMALSTKQREDWGALSLILREAFQALVLARMLIRQEQTYKGATWVTYVNSPDGRAALARGDVADVVARRLPD